jgi:hypothetical protein
MRTLLREPGDASDEGPVEAAFQVGGLVVTVAVCLVVAVVWLSR